MIEFKNIAMETYSENAPNTIGFLEYRYGPIVTSFLVWGLIDTPNPSAGPPLPILNRNTFDHIRKNAPVLKNNNEIMYRSVIAIVNSLSDNMLSSLDNSYNPNGINIIKMVIPKMYPKTYLPVSFMLLPYLIEHSIKLVLLVKTIMVYGTPGLLQPQLSPAIFQSTHRIFVWHPPHAHRYLVHLFHFVFSWLRSGRCHCGCF